MCPTLSTEKHGSQSFTWISHVSHATIAKKLFLSNVSKLSNVCFRFSCYNWEAALKISTRIRNADSLHDNIALTGD